MKTLLLRGPSCSVSPSISASRPVILEYETVFVCSAVDIEVPPDDGHIPSM